MPSKPRLKFRILIILGIVLLLGILAVAFPLAKASNRPPLHLNFADAQLHQMAARLRMIEAAKEEWAYVNKKSMRDGVSIMDLTQYFKNNSFPGSILGEYYTVGAVGDFAEAHLPTNYSLNGKSGPFTLTSFD